MRWYLNNSGVGLVEVLTAFVLLGILVVLFSQWFSFQSMNTKRLEATMDFVALATEIRLLLSNGRLCGSGFRTNTGNVRFDPDGSIDQVNELRLGPQTIAQTGRTRGGLTITEMTLSEVDVTARGAESIEGITYDRFLGQLEVSAVRTLANTPVKKQFLFNILTDQTTKEIKSCLFEPTVNASDICDSLGGYYDFSETKCVMIGGGISRCDNTIAENSLCNGVPVKQCAIVSCDKASFGAKANTTCNRFKTPGKKTTCNWDATKSEWYFLTRDGNKKYCDGGIYLDPTLASSCVAGTQ